MELLHLASCFIGKKPNAPKMPTDNTEASYFDIFRIKKIFHSEVYFWSKMDSYKPAKVDLETLDFFNLLD